MPLPALQKRASQHTEIVEIEGGWRLGLPAEQGLAYQLAQLDDYARVARSKLSHRPPFVIRLRARSSAAEMPGTWGFGLWNDPFGLSLGLGGKRGQLPALPNAAWFFFASSENHLSLRNDQPGHGALAAVFRSPHPPSLLLAPAILLTPLLLIPPISRVLRKVASRVIGSETLQLSLDSSVWHEYGISWREDTVTFTVDGEVAFRTTMAPYPPLGLVLWIDNQHAAWRPDGSFSSGTLPTPQDCWVEITDLEILTH